MNNVITIIKNKNENIPNTARNVLSVGPVKKLAILDLSLFMYVYIKKLRIIFHINL